MFDPRLAVEHQHGAVVGVVLWPPLAGDTGPGEGPPPVLDVVADPQRRLAVHSGREQGAQRRPVHVEDREQFGRVRGAQARPVQRRRFSSRFTAVVPTRFRCLAVDIRE